MSVFYINIALLLLSCGIGGIIWWKKRRGNGKQALFAKVILSIVFGICFVGYWIWDKGSLLVVLAGIAFALSVIAVFVQARAER